jgi:cytochrome c-type biogenesis protein CcmH/NrfF
MLVMLLILWLVVIPVAAVVVGFVLTTVRENARSRSERPLRLVRRESWLAQTTLRP